MQVKNVSVKNYGMLKDLRLDEFKALNVFIGPNATGKSTVIQVLDYVLEAGSLTIFQDSAFRATVSELIEVDCGIALDKSDVENTLREIARANGRPPPEEAIVDDFERV